MRMVSHHDGSAWIHEQPVLQPICGRGMDQLVLDSKDLGELISLKPEQMRTWLEDMRSRFYKVE